MGAKYRMLRDGTGRITICEVGYGAAGGPEWANPAEPGGATRIELVNELALFHQALNHPMLEWCSGELCDVKR